MDFDLLPTWMSVLSTNPIFGCDNDEADANEDSDSADGSGDEAGDGDGDSDDGGDDADGDDDADGKKGKKEDPVAEARKRLREEKRARRRAEAERDEAQRLIEAHEDAKEEVLEDIVEERDDLRQKLAASLNIIEDWAVERAIGRGKREWEDVDTVMALLDFDDLDIDLETGEIDGLEEALEDLAKSKPFLLKKRVKQERNPDSGDAPGAGNRGNRDKKKSRKEWAQSNPAYTILTR